MTGKHPKDRNTNRHKEAAREIMTWIMSQESVGADACLAFMGWCSQRKLSSESVSFREWISNTNIDISKDQFLVTDIYNLKACVEQPTSMEEVWSRIKWVHELRTISPSNLLTCINILLRQPTLVGEGKRLIKEAQYRGIPLSSGVYSELIMHCSKTLDDCMAYFKEAERLKIIDAALYDRYLQATLQFDNSFDVAHAAFKTFLRDYPLDTGKQWTSVMRSACKEKRFTEALSLFQHAPQGLGLLAAPLIDLCVSETREMIGQNKPVRKSLMYFSDLIFREIAKRGLGVNISRKSYQEWQSVMKTIPGGDKYIADTGKVDEPHKLPQRFQPKIDREKQQYSP